MKDYGPKSVSVKYLTLTEVEQILAENQRLREENDRLEGEVKKWVNLTLGGIAARDKSMWDLMMSGLFDDKSLERVRQRQSGAVNGKTAT
jgi:hypothetical protein